MIPLKKSAKQEHKRRSWSELPDDILKLFLKQLSAEDHHHFAGVCKSWRSVSLPLIHAKTPWIIVEFSPRNPTCSFFTPWGNKHYKLDLPETQSRYLRGSSKSWLVTTDVSRSKISVLDPFSRIQIHLPPLLDIAFFSSLQVAFSNGSDGMVIMITAIFSNQAWFCKPKDEAWRKFQIPDCGNFYNLVFYKGLFYVINRQGVVSMCNVYEDPPKVTELGGLPGPIGLYDRYYLLESCGELFSVFQIHRLNSSEVKAFMVFKMEDGGGGSKWVRVGRLEDCAFFVAMNNSMAISEKEIYGCRNNSIYFTQDVTKEKQVLSRYDLKDGSITCLNTTYDRHGCYWIAPSW